MNHFEPSPTSLHFPLHLSVNFVDVGKTPLLSSPSLTICDLSKSQILVYNSHLNHVDSIFPELWARMSAQALILVCITTTNSTRTNLSQEVFLKFNTLYYFIHNPWVWFLLLYKTLHQFYSQHFQQLFRFTKFELQVLPFQNCVAYSTASSLNYSFNFLCYCKTLCIK